jgi:hypothetical protein
MDQSGAIALFLSSTQKGDRTFLPSPQKGDRRGEWRAIALFHNALAKRRDSASLFE